MSIPRTLISGFIGLVSCGDMVGIGLRNHCGSSKSIRTGAGPFHYYQIFTTTLQHFYGPFMTARMLPAILSRVEQDFPPGGRSGRETTAHPRAGGDAPDAQETCLAPSGAGLCRAV